MRDRAAAFAFVVICTGQLIGWGSASLLSVGASTIAAELGLLLPTAFAGNTVFFVMLGLAAPLLAPSFSRYGARPVMVSGALVSAGGYGLLSVSQDALGYFSAWAILGAGGAACLSTAAHILLSERPDGRAASAISALMLITGLSASIFLPTNAFLIGTVGWRGTCLVVALLMIAVAGAYALALPRRAAPAIESANKAPGPDASPGAPVFLLIAASITFSAFVTFGLSAILIELLVSEGLAPSTAVLFGSILGVVQVGARGLDLIGKGRIDAVATGLAATVLVTFALAMLLVAGSATVALAAFIVFYGIGSGVFAVTRATLPLAFYSRDAYAAAASRISLPLNLVAAGAAPLLAWLLTTSGARAVLAIALAASLGASTLLVALLRLHRKRMARPAKTAETQAA